MKIIEKLKWDSDPDFTERMNTYHFYLHLNNENLIQLVAKAVESCFRLWVCLCFYCSLYACYVHFFFQRVELSFQESGKFIRLRKFRKPTRLKRHWEERERERERQRETERDRETHTQRDTDTHRQTEREIEMDRVKKRWRERQKDNVLSYQAVQKILRIQV